MKQDVRLYIADRLVDFSSELSIPFTYQIEDTNNPTIIKNSFTKTITIVGTKNNNKIFGEIYNLDREQLYDDNYIVGAYFNPSFRTPFKIYNNGDVIESGYMQLNDVVIKNKVINYNITLYGGLGDFFYNLSYNQENEPLQLKDLKYDIDLSFDIDKNIVRKAWEHLNEYDEDRITDTLTFIPCYNGLYENFDNDKVLINTTNSTLFPNVSTTVDGVTYSPYNGYALAELNKELTEWEMRSLMSYKQRPAIKLSKFVEACCKLENNGGYQVVLDDEFFNKSNPYYNKAYIALPLLETKISGTEGDIIEEKLEINTNSWVGLRSGIKQVTTASDIKVVGSGITMDSNGVISTIGTNVSTQFDMELDVQLFFKAEDNYTGDLYSTTFRVYDINGGAIPYASSVLLQIEAVDADRGASLGRSDIYNFTTPIDIFNVTLYSNPKIWKNWTNPTSSPVQDVFGYYSYSSQIDKHYFHNNDGNNTFRLKINNVKKADRIKFQLIMKTVSNTENDWTWLYKQPAFNFWDDTSPVLSDGYWTGAADKNTSTLSMKTSDVVISSGQKITQDLLLKTEKTPCDFLLSYCKMFGLYFDYDITQKKIYILKRNNYFTGEIKDITDRIDWSKDFKINPILYDKKFYKLALEDNGSYLTDKYKNEYNVEYGQKRINTNYNFNSETTELFKDNIYQNVVSMVDDSLYYRTFFDSAGTQQPPMVVDNMTYKVFNTDEADIRETDIEVYGSEHIDLSKTVNWNTRAGYDFTDKLCCYSKEDTKTLADISSTIVFFDGYYKPVDLNGNNVVYWLVDDVPEMFLLNENQCHLYTESEFDLERKWIAYKLTEIPRFTKYIVNDNKITDSWDFGKPKELYIPDIEYNDNVTIYNQYWSKMYEDKLNINTKVVTAYVNLDGLTVNSNLLKDFYYFNNCYWVLNKIENYDVNSYATVKCEFIKINDISSYISDIGKKYDYFFVDDNYITVPYTSGSVTTQVHSTTPWEVFWYNTYKITNISPMSGAAGVTTITIDYNDNNNKYDEEPFYLSMTTTNNMVNRITIDINQLPNMDNVVELYGKIKYWNNSLIPNGVVLIYDTDYNTVYDSRYLDEYTGEYKVFAPKGIDFGLEVQTTNGDWIYRNTFKYNESSNLNLNIFSL